jgi:hypothetical protein
MCREREEVFIHGPTPDFCFSGCKKPEGMEAAQRRALSTFWTYCCKV